MIFHRGRYVDALIRKQWNGRIKVITGIRRCGKSTVLFDLFRTDWSPAELIRIILLLWLWMMIAGGISGIPMPWQITCAAGSETAVRTATFFLMRSSMPYPGRNSGILIGR